MTPGLARQLEVFTGTPARYWERLWRLHDDYRADAEDTAVLQLGEPIIEEGFNAYYSDPAGKVATALLALARLVLEEAIPGHRNDPEATEARAPICRISPLEEALTRWAEVDEEGQNRVVTILDAMGAKDPAARAAHAVLVWAAQVYKLATRTGAS